MNLGVGLSSNHISCGMFIITNEFLFMVKERQLVDLIREQMEHGIHELFVGVNGVLKFKGIICVSNDN